MKNIRFYLEYDTPKDKRKNHNKGNVIAVFANQRIWSEDGYGCIGAFLDTPNSPVCTSSVLSDYLHTNCKRINEDIARIIHPKLFETINIWTNIH